MQAAMKTPHSACTCTPSTALARPPRRPSLYTSWPVEADRNRRPRTGTKTICSPDTTGHRALSSWTDMRWPYSYQTVYFRIVGVKSLCSWTFLQRTFQVWAAQRHSPVALAVCPYLLDCRSPGSRGTSPQRAAGAALHPRRRAVCGCRNRRNRQGPPAVTPAAARAPPWATAVAHPPATSVSCPPGSSGAPSREICSSGGRIPAAARSNPSHVCGQARKSIKTTNLV